MTAHEPKGIEVRWDLQIPLRDGAYLSAILYRSRTSGSPRPVILSVTPYIAQVHHEKARILAERGYVFVSVDVRGRGNSSGEFRPFENEGRDGFDTVEWIAQQSFCNGKVAMVGASYEAYVEWVTAARRPPHLTTIIPVAAPMLGEDFPIRKNIASAYLIQWLTVVTGKAAQDRVFSDSRFYAGQFEEWCCSGKSFRQLDAFMGLESPTFQEWLDHPCQSDYWDRLNPTDEQYSQISIPILTITGAYDGDQSGALSHYRKHNAYAPGGINEAHYLVIGPWDHGGTITPRAEVGGIRLGAASVLDMHALRREWLDWVLESGPKPHFLQKRVAYYVAGAETWCYVDTLNQVTRNSERLFLQSSRNPTDVFQSGAIVPGAAMPCDPAEYIYDPADLSLAQLESDVSPDSLIDQSLIFAARGRQLVYHGAACVEPVEISGFFEATLWISINQPDTDIRLRVYEITREGASVFLTGDWVRARFRRGLRAEYLVQDTQPLPYDFSGFTFISRLVGSGSRLRLVIDSYDSIYSQRNRNSGKPVSEESSLDARPVTVRVFQDPEHPSVLYVPYGSSLTPKVDFETKSIVQANSTGPADAKR